MEKITSANLYELRQEMKDRKNCTIYITKLFSEELKKLPYEEWQKLSFDLRQKGIKLVEE